MTKNVGLGKNITTLVAAAFTVFSTHQYELSGGLGPILLHHHHHQPINVSTLGAQALLMDYT
jgi:hypothetical protein